MKFKETIIAFIISVILVVSLEYTNNKIKFFNCWKSLLDNQQQSINFNLLDVLMNVQRLAARRTYLYVEKETN